MIFLLRSRHDVGGRRKKKRPTQLCTTQLYKNIQTSKFHTDYFITSFCIIASLRSHLATIASVEFSWFGTKTYPIPTHLVASHHETLQSPTNLRTCRIGWGEPKAKRKHCTRTPCVSGRESHPLFSNTHTHTHTSSNASDHESAGATSHWRHCVSAFFIAADVNVCVWVVESRSLVKNFQFQNGDRRVFATFLFGSSGNVSNATLRRRVSFPSTDCT